MLQCYNRGCGQTYDPANNTDESCSYHPGEPYFHDAYKGWSCCKKKSVDFTEFLNIKGCCLAKHSNEKPPEPEKPPKTESDKDEIIEVRAPIKEPLPRPAVATPMVQVQASIAPALKETIDALKGTKLTSREGLTPGEITVGTVCKNNGCTYAFTNAPSDSSECIYHPGVPIFHEGLKFWSCCQKRTSDFAVFMAQKGCSYGQHKWVKEDEDKKVVQCRYDWHQTGANVIVSIYAKKYHYSLSSIEVNPVRLRVMLDFPEQENAKFNLDLELRGIIDVAKTSAHMYGTKVEITLPKMEAGSWPKLNFPSDKLPPVQDSKAAKISSNEQNDDSDDGFNLDDIESVNNYGVRLTEITSNNRNNLD